MRKRGRAGLEALAVQKSCFRDGGTRYDAPSAQIGNLTSRIEELIAAIPAAQGIDADGTTGPSAGTGPAAPVLPCRGPR